MISCHLHMVVINVDCVIEIDAAIRIIRCFCVLNNIRESGLVYRSKSVSAGDQLNHLRLIEARSAELRKEFIFSPKLIGYSSIASLSGINSTALVRY